VNLFSGDCYFLSALSMLAETPQRVLDLFQPMLQTAEADPEKLNGDGVNGTKAGCYGVRMCKQGRW
jgi:hypothetical protein